MEFLTGIWLAVLGLFGVIPEQTTPAMIEEPTLAPESALIETEGTMSDDRAAEVDGTSTADTAPSASTSELDNLNDTMSETNMSTNDTTSPTSPAIAATPDVRTALVAGGCFWCVESDLEKTPGVLSAVSGYAGGTTENPTYDNYGSGGHREVVEVTYDANQISYEAILIVTMKTTDPTDDNGTFADRGDKYSAAFYYENDEQLAIINNLIAEVNENGPYDKPLAIDIEQRPKFWAAEDFHQDYYKGTLSQLKYKYYRNASGRDDFIQAHWGDDRSPSLPWRSQTNQTSAMSDTPSQTYAWAGYVKPDKETLRQTLDPLAFKVTQEDGTERAGTSWLDKNYERGIYVDILSGEPLYSSRDKFDSGTGWPSFTKPITPDALTLHEDRKLFTVRTETRSAIADNHLGHVFDDGPADRGGKRYCMNGAALRFVPEADMVAEGYEDFLPYL